MELGNELKVERIRLQLKAKNVAETIGLSPQQLSNIEQSEGMNTIAKYIAFLRSKGVDLNALFDRIETNKK
jgi:transcriptional regulator with XRE-family HTH domain